MLFSNNEGNLFWNLNKFKRALEALGREFYYIGNIIRQPTILKVYLYYENTYHIIYIFIFSIYLFSVKRIMSFCLKHYVVSFDQLLR